MSAFALEDGVVYHTYSAYARGLDGLWGMYQWLDRAPKGRNEEPGGGSPPRRVLGGRDGRQAHGSGRCHESIVAGNQGRRVVLRGARLMPGEVRPATAAADRRSRTQGPGRPDRAGR